MAKDYRIQVTNTDDGAAVTSLPTTPEKLGAFISGLLGQSQSIERAVYGTLDVDHAWTLHIHALLQQRITQQNEASLASFKATIYCESGVTRTLTSYEAYHHFHETQQIVTLGVKMEWAYLVKFPNKEMPEKQAISFQVKSVPAESDFSVRTLSRWKSGSILYAIDHTQRTWGDDIETILRGEVDKVVREPSRAFKYFSLLAPVFALLAFFGGVFLPELFNDYFANQHYERLRSAIPSVDKLRGLDLSSKVDVLLSYHSPLAQPPRISSIVRVMSCVIGLVPYFLTPIVLGLQKSSFVVLSEKAQEFRKNTSATEKRRTLLAWLSFAGAIATGVIGNYIYALLTAVK